ncbi:MAG: helix-turn-helix transcriptional regulator [Pseudomonadota bacterium]
MSHPHTREELAEIASCSVWHLDRLFRGVLGLSPMSYLAALRIDAAKRQLVTTDNRIIDICYSVGYTSLGSFGKRFQRMVGFSPRQLRVLAKELDPSVLFAQLRCRCDSPQDGGTMVPIRLHPSSASAAPSCLILVGAFRSNVPTLMPMACAIREGFGDVWLPTPSASHCRVFALAVPTSASAAELILQDSCWLGVGDRLLRGSAPLPEKIQVELRPASGYELPLLPAMALHLQKSSPANGSANSNSFGPLGRRTAAPTSGVSKSSKPVCGVE